MSAILGAPVVTDPNLRSGNKCIYKATTGICPYVELSVDMGDGKTAMAAMGSMEKAEPGITSPYDGIGDQAATVGTALIIRTGEDLVPSCSRVWPTRRQRPSDLRHREGQNVTRILRAAACALVALCSSATLLGRADAPAAVPLVPGLTFVLAVHNTVPAGNATVKGVAQGDYELVVAVTGVDSGGLDETTHVEGVDSRTCSTVRRFVSPVRVVQSIDLPTGSPISAVPMGVSTEMLPFEMSASFG